MKRALTLLALTGLFAWQHRERLDAWLHPAPVASGSGEVVLYATSWCGYCAKTRALLKEHAIPYREWDVEQSDEGRRAFRALGGRGVPLVVVRGTVIAGYDPDGVLAAYRAP
ncbi:glutaredoxin family protein [Pseudomonas mangiferae]|uniref:Glutaredoxin family protein n=1 Tax=Pseudomonas mangiferae TaxID=2593654 RepID=A0A553H0U7_9PSED|nr:glutaredoxin family protein [Pseudomonas mangiferae]TRX75373.1 glutaredoxin family protein [Pseudomonas mangiferae]